ncbi:DUF6174 domain-containing protein [Psychroserpens sp.]
MFQKVILPLVCICVFISCSSDDDFTDELNANRQLWQSSQLKNYSINERLSCFCGGLLEWNLYVKDGVKDNVVFDESQLLPNQTHDDVLNNAKKVEEAFNFIGDLLNQNVASLLIEYDAEYGFPTLISIDYNADFVDDEIAYTYTNFEVIN